MYFHYVTVFVLFSWMVLFSYQREIHLEVESNKTSVR